MKTKLFILYIFLSLFDSSAFAVVNNPDDFKAYLLLGYCNINQGSFKTGNDGQMYVMKKEDFEIRLKQDTSVSISDSPFALTDELVLDKGIMGLKVASDTLFLKTPFANIRMRNATVVVRVSDNLVRICVIKGSCVVMQKTNIVLLEMGKEIAASKNQLSKQYKYLDDLRYVWYWTTPDKEPALRPE